MRRTVSDTCCVCASISALCEVFSVKPQAVASYKIIVKQSKHSTAQTDFRICSYLILCQCIRNRRITTLKQKQVNNTNFRKCVRHSRHTAPGVRTFRSLLEINHTVCSRVLAKNWLRHFRDFCVLSRSKYTLIRKKTCTFFLRNSQNYQPISIQTSDNTAVGVLTKNNSSFC